MSIFNDATSVYLDGNTNNKIVRIWLDGKLWWEKSSFSAKFVPSEIYYDLSDSNYKYFTSSGNLIILDEHINLLASNGTIYFEFDGWTENSKSNGLFKLSSLSDSGQDWEISKNVSLNTSHSGLTEIIEVSVWDMEQDLTAIATLKIHIIGDSGDIEEPGDDNDGEEINPMDEYEIRLETEFNPQVSGTGTWDATISYSVWNVTTDEKYDYVTETIEGEGYKGDTAYYTLIYSDDTTGTLEYPLEGTVQ